MFKIESIKENYPVIIGVASTLFIGFCIYLIGNLSESKAEDLIKQYVDNFSMLCNTIILACATILGLLLNALGTSRQSETNIKEKHYKGIITLTSVVTFAFISALFSFLLLLFPITEANSISVSLYNNLYWAMLIVCSLLVGTTITIALMLRKVIINITKVTALKDGESDLIVEDDEEDEMKEDMNDDEKEEVEENKKDK